MANSVPGSVSAAQVGSYFVGQYYRVLQQQPDFVHQFYKDESTMTRVDGDACENASELLEIHTLITSLNFTEIEIKTINSLESLNGGVLVMVSGSVKAKHVSGRRKFMQTFFLAPQEKGYFVLNDIFQFVEEESIHHHLESVISENKVDSQINASPLPELPVSSYGLEEEATEYVNSAHIDEEDDTVDKYSLPDQQHQQEGDEPVPEIVVEETPVEEEFSAAHQHMNAEAEPLPAPVEEPIAEPPKQTYASILRAARGKPAPPVSNQTSYYQSTPTPPQPASDWQYTPATTPQQSNYASQYVPLTGGESAEEGSTLEEEGESRSVYVRNLPTTIESADIEQEFKNFGRIKPDGVFVRNRKEIGICYAFVEFEDTIGVQNAIKASPILLGGREVHIEERRASGSTSRGGGGGRRGRGRGSYQADAARGGRVGGRNLGGDYSRARGNGFHRGSR